jgi:hypothetical protein
MTTDRELIELAAKAAGIEVEFAVFSDDSFICFEKGGDCFRDEWNPLTDDGDALRLAVTLKITPHIDGNLTDAESIVGFATKAHFNDPYAATRRAIVKAAAEIGRTL